MPIVRKWNLTIESPAKFMRALEDFLHDELLYNVAYVKKPELVGTALEGTAKFEGEIRAVKMGSKRSILRVVLGIALALLGVVMFPFEYLTLDFALMDFTSVEFLVAVVPLFLGLILLASSNSHFSLAISVRMDGESYKAEAGKDAAEEKAVAMTLRRGVISDVRLVVQGAIERGSGQAKWNLIAHDIALLSQKIEMELVPSFRLPGIEGGEAGRKYSIVEP